MKKILTTLILTMCCLTIFAQDKITDEIITLLDSCRYDKIIEQHAPKSKDYSAGSLYYIGYAYLMQQDDNNCIKFMDLSISKNTKNPAPHYIKGTIYNSMGKYSKAIKCFEAAINIKADEALFYIGLGDAYYELKKDEIALINYKKATEQNVCPDRPYAMIVEIYCTQQENDKALEAAYRAKSKIAQGSNMYLNALFNIGQFESQKSNYDEAESAFLELIQLNPTDYHAYAKIIQICYHKKEYDKAQPYKDRLYEAYSKGELKGNLSDMFCFDQFNWNGYSVQVYERYENRNKGNIYNKHIFYVIDSAENIVLRVQTEFSPISMEFGGSKYILCGNYGDMHINSGKGFNDDLKYDDLKTSAIELFTEYLK